MKLIYILFIFYSNLFSMDNIGNYSLGYLYVDNYNINNNVNSLIRINKKDYIYKNELELINFKNSNNKFSRIEIDKGEQLKILGFKLINNNLFLYVQINKN